MLRKVFEYLTRPVHYYLPELRQTDNMTVFFSKKKKKKEKKKKKKER